MLTIKIIFWFLFFLVFYTYIGYGILLFIIIKIRRILGFSVARNERTDYEPEVTLFITAFNEKDYVQGKMENSRELDYPADKLRIVWVTDGSDDGTPEEIKKYEGVDVYHLPQRNGKIGAMNRGMQFVKTPVVVFCDANTMLGKESIRRIVRLFSNPKVGCVSGEKRIFSKEKDAAAGAGEGLYWKYESTLKKWDAELYSVVGAAGELFAIRTELYRDVERDTLLDDFIISLRVAQEGYTIQYDPEAYAIETASSDVKEELKRKVRISAGGIQSVIRLWPLLNIFKYGTLSFQYISHRVLRWTLAPLSLLFLLPLGFLLALSENFTPTGFYTILFGLQVLFYLSALLGWYLENKLIRVKLLFVPYYFFIMNLSVFLGLKRYIKGSQSVNWERAKRGR
ncbi:MAG: glycosyl transferase [Bacteroidetes bacterium HGW-Bacteroidetes-11]|jgi:cellulose synthase/poly-beta-1,6-N-acetylglucosamine synthase-like glycosyltransferase|nr:MAG: glycosyl transferase [Bacteroidetes bacterium HGW-Bacteroidetes-11]